MPSHADHLAGRRSLIALAAILILAGVVRMYAFHGYGGLDDGEYARLAYRMAHGQSISADYTGPAVFPVRIGVVAPTALVFRLFGVNEATMVSFPFVMSMLGLVAAYVSTALFFGARAGLIAALLLSFFPWDIDQSTTLLPDLPSAVFASCAITIVIALDRLNVERRALLVGGGLASGLLFGLAWLCKESVSYAAPFCAIYMIISIRENGRRLFWVWSSVGLGALLVLSGEMATYWWLHADPFFRVHEVERNFAQWSNGFFTEGSSMGWKRGESYGSALLNRLFVDGPRVMFLEPSLLYLLPVAAAATAYAWFSRKREFLIPALWLWTLVLMFNFASNTIRTYTPLALYIRYMSPMFVPGAILVAGFIDRTVFGSRDADQPSWKALAFRATGVAAAGLIAWTALPQVYRSIKYPPRWWTAEVRALKAEVTPERVVYSDALSLRAFEFAHSYPSRTAWVGLDDVASSGDIPPGALVIVNKRYLEWLGRNAGMWVAWPKPHRTSETGYLHHEFFDHPPSSWRPVWQNGNAVVYSVGSSAP